MVLTRRAVAAALVASPLAARAQGAAFPGGRPVKLVVPFPAGGSTDVIARLLGERLAARWGSPVVIENKPGAGGNIGAAQVAQAAPDGLEMLAASVSFSTNHHIFRQLPFDPVRDFAPVGLIATVPNALLVGPHVAAGSVTDLIAAARATPGRLTYGSAGIGTSAHLAGELFCSLTGVTMTHVPYRGTGPALTDLVGGRLDVLFDILTAAIPQIRSGAARALGVTSRGRSSILPDLAPVAETVPGFEATTWNGLFLPARVGSTIVEKVSRDMAASLAEPSTRARFAELAVEPVGSTPAELARWLEAESAKWGALIRAANIRVDG